MDHNISTCLGGAGSCGDDLGGRLRVVVLKDGVDEGSWGQRGVYVRNEWVLFTLENRRHLRLRAGWLLFDISWLALPAGTSESLRYLRLSNLWTIKVLDLIGPHPKSVQSVTASSGVEAAISVMSEMIGPEFVGESGERRLAGVWGDNMEVNHQSVITITNTIW